MKRNHDLEAKLPLYALNALEESEMKELDRYLQEFPEAMTEYKELKDAADLLPYTTPLRNPPPDLKSMVMDHVHADLEANPAPEGVAMKTRQLRPQRPTSSPAEATAGPWQHLNDWWQNMKTGPALPVALAFSLIGIGLVTSRLLTEQNRAEQLSHQVSGLGDDLEKAEELNAALENELDSLTAANEQLQLANKNLLTQLESSEQLIAYAADTDSQRLTLPGTDAQPSASGGLFIRPDTGELLLVISQLEPLTEDQIYQLWLIEDQPMSAGLIKISPEGSGIFEIDVALSDFGFSAVGVSVEPAGGSDQPTGDIVMFAESQG